MVWPLDKLSLIQDCLLQTGNRLVNDADDGSEEWNICSSTYEAAITYAIEGHDWKFGTKVAELTRTGVDPEDARYTDAYAKPQDLLHLIWVKIDTTDIDYAVVGNQIYAVAGGDTIHAKYLTQPGPDQVTPMFMMALRAFVMSGIYRGLGKDADKADRMWANGERFLDKAKTRADQETPSRSIFQSNLVAARSRRRG